MRVTNGDETLKTFELRREALDAYDRAHRDADAPVAAQEHLVVERVSSDAFAVRHREASAKWRDAEALLWADDSARNLTTIGHLCREAMQLFVTRLIELHNVTTVAEDNPARTINRLHAVIEAWKPGIGSRTAALLDALCRLLEGDQRLGAAPGARRTERRRGPHLGGRTTCRALHRHGHDRVRRGAVVLYWRIGVGDSPGRARGSPQPVSALARDQLADS